MALCGVACLTPAGAPFQIATPSNGEAIPSKIDFAVAVEAGSLGGYTVTKLALTSDSLI